MYMPFSEEAEGSDTGTRSSTSSVHDVRAKKGFEAELLDIQFLPLTRLPWKNQLIYDEAGSPLIVRGESKRISYRTRKEKILSYISLSIILEKADRSEMGR